jgi:hypothetical protein
MTPDQKIHEFLSQYNEEVSSNALKLRKVLLENLPDIIEQIDVPARMIAYCYGQKYSSTLIFGTLIWTFQ